MPRGGQTSGKINLGLSRTAHTPAGRRDHLGRSPVIGCDRVWAALTSGSEALGWEAVQEKRSGLISARSLFLPSPHPTPSSYCGGGRAPLGTLAPEPAPQVLPRQAQVVRRMHGATMVVSWRLLSSEQSRQGRVSGRGAREGGLWVPRTTRGCNSEHYSLLTFHLRVLQKWPMRSRLYAGGLGCSGLDSTTATTLGQRTKEAEARPQVPGEADALLPTSSW